MYEKKRERSFLSHGWLRLFYLVTSACIQKNLLFVYADWAIKKKCSVVKVLTVWGSIFAEQFNVDAFFDRNFNWVTADYVWILFLPSSHCLLIYPGLVWKSEESLTDYLFLHLVFLSSFILFAIYPSQCISEGCALQV